MNNVKVTTFPSGVVSDLLVIYQYENYCRVVYTFIPAGTK